MVEITYQGPTYKLDLFGRDKNDFELADYLKNLICYNQGEFIQYSFLAAEFHKCMKIAYGEGDFDAARECKNLLVDFLNRNFERITKRNFDFVKSHFKKRDKLSPRVCVKAGYDIGNHESVIELFRDGNVNYKSDCHIEENTGFKFIYDTGRPFLCNDIPAKAKIGEYINPRISIPSAKLYQSPGFIKKKLGLHKGRDEAWKNCWKTFGKKMLQVMRVINQL